MKNILVLVSFLFFGFTLSNANTIDCRESSKALEREATLKNGRIKPLYVHAAETIYRLTGSTTLEKSLTPIESYCLLSQNKFPLEKITIKVQHVDLKKFLSKWSDDFNYQLALTHLQEIKSQLSESDISDSYRKNIQTLIMNINTMNSIISGEDWDLYSTKNSIDKDLRLKLDIELFYAKSHLSMFALTFTLIALILYFLNAPFATTLIASGISVAIQILLVSIRIFISGRAPITNMYETVLFSGLGALLLGLILGHIKKEALYVYMGLGYNICTLFMINFSGGLLSATISPLVPVLRDNFWLSTHVTMVILSYGALALSWIMANTLIIKKRLGKLSLNEENKSSLIIYEALKWGTTMLALGVILGGVWADYSWGRFWGWDPKETWSLIVLCLYMAILHGRYTSWIKKDKFITFVALAFMSVMMAWFGVNYILATGLHSYGFSEGGALFLGVFFILQIAVALLNITSKEPLT